ncbi:7996_t:CDS:1, partial [Ambispora gerdemannii]
MSVNETPDEYATILRQLANEIMEGPSQLEKQTDFFPLELTTTSPLIPITHDEIITTTNELQTKKEQKIEELNKILKTA